MKKEKRWILAALLLTAISLLSISILSYPASAKTQVFSDQLLSGESIDVDDFTFIITMNKYANAVFVSGGGLYQTVPIETCQNMDHFEVCFDNTTYNEEDNELYILFRMYRYQPDVSISRTINTSEMFVGKEAKVTLKIQNTADTASQIEMNDDYPASVQIYDMEGGCSIHENQVYWKGHLDEGKSKECTFIIKGTKELHQSFVAQLKYWDGFKWVEKFSTTMTLDINPVVEIYSRIVREDYEVDGTTLDMEDENPGIYAGEVFRLIVNITNEYDDDIKVDKLEINLPPYLEYQTIGSLRFNFLTGGNRSGAVWSSSSITKVSPQKLTWSYRLDNKTSKLFILKILAKETGRQNIIINTKYNYDNMAFSDTTQETFDVADPSIGIRMTVTDKSRRFSAPERLDDEEDTIDLESLHPYDITIYAQNLNKYSILKNVNIKIITDIAGFSPVYYPQIDEEGQKIPYRLVLIPPYLTGSKEFPINVSFTYLSEFGETFENSTEFKINVQEQKELTINVDSSEGETLEGGEETEMVVSITNDRLIDIKDVDVKDIIPEEIHVEGLHARRLKLNKESDTDLYKYRIKMPIVHKNKHYNITTHVSFFDPDSRTQVNFSKVTELLIEPLKPDVSIDVTYDKPDDIYPGTLIPVEYVVTNDEEKERARELTVHFPLSEDFDLIGPMTFFIDKLDPAESVTITNLVKIRPKLVKDAMSLNITRVEYKDDYGNLFDENSSEESIDVEDANINGPAIFLNTQVPSAVNKSADAEVKIIVENKGNSPADLTVTQGDRAWNISVDKMSSSTISYNLRYEQVGNYTIPETYARFSMQGMDAYTIGKGAELKVMLLEGPAAAIEEATQEAEAKETEEPEKEEMSFEEYFASIKGTDQAQMKKLLMILIIAGVVAGVILIYISSRKSKPGTSMFMEQEKK